MTPIEIKQYLIGRKIATLTDIAIHFRIETDSVKPMLDMWVQKGKVIMNDGDSGCQKGCCQCDPETLVTYEWIG